MLMLGKGKKEFCHHVVLNPYDFLCKTNVLYGVDSENESNQPSIYDTFMVLGY